MSSRALVWLWGTTSYLSLSLPLSYRTITVRIFWYRSTSRHLSDPKRLQSMLEPPSSTRKRTKFVNNSQNCTSNIAQIVRINAVFDLLDKKHRARACIYLVGMMDHLVVVVVVGGLMMELLPGSRAPPPRPSGPRRLHRVCKLALWRGSQLYRRHDLLHPQITVRYPRSHPVVVVEPWRGLSSRPEQLVRTWNSLEQLARTWGFQVRASSSRCGRQFFVISPQF